MAWLVLLYSQQACGHAGSNPHLNMKPCNSLWFLCHVLLPLLFMLHKLQLLLQMLQIIQHGGGCGQDCGGAGRHDQSLHFHTEPSAATCL